VVYAEDDAFPKLRHKGAGFAVARLMQSRAEEIAGYSTTEMDRIAKMLKGWAKDQEVFAFFISGTKERNPAAAMALQEKLGVKPAGDAPAPAPKKAPAKKAPAGKK
jgi:uncharacterized protein YecE (DUF72 family)